MQPTRIASNPFALMMNPDAVLRAMESSDRLQRLQRRVCRPLDKPLIPRVGHEVADFDLEVDNADDTDLE
ncbi:MAG TPA: hypothetical protein VJM48_11960 [Methylibium sp.]|nr:hypothetical protein [Methylibium sp.]